MSRTGHEWMLYFVVEARFLNPSFSFGATTCCFNTRFVTTLLRAITQKTTGRPSDRLLFLARTYAGTFCFYATVCIPVVSIRFHCFVSHYYNNQIKFTEKDRNLYYIRSSPCRHLLLRIGLIRRIVEPHPLRF